MTGDGDDGRTSRAGRRERSKAEWVTFAVACVVLAVVVGAIATLAAGGPLTPPSFKVTPIGNRQIDGRFHVRALVENEGDETARNVQVVAELRSGGKAPAEAEQVIDFLAGGDGEEVEFIFGDDPAEGRLEVEVRSFKAR